VAGIEISVPGSRREMGCYETAALTSPPRRVALFLKLTKVYPILLDTWEQLFFSRL